MADPDRPPPRCRQRLVARATRRPFGCLPRKDPPPQDDLVPPLGVPPSRRGCAIARRRARVLVSPPSARRRRRPDRTGDHEGTSLEGASETVEVSLDPAATLSILTEVPARVHSQVHELLVMALAVAYRTATGRTWLWLHLEGHGRETLFPGVDVSRTVGWFTSLYPALLEIEQGGDLFTALETVKAQLRAIPRRGIGYGLARYLHPDPDIRVELARVQAPQLAFNYFGRLDAGAPSVDAPRCLTRVRPRPTPAARACSRAERAGRRNRLRLHERTTPREIPARPSRCLRTRGWMCCGRSRPRTGSPIRSGGFRRCHAQPARA